MPTKAVSLFHVRYEAGDKLGKLLAWASLLPSIMAVGIFPVLLYIRRDVTLILFWLGIMGSHALNHMIKDTLRFPRPPTCEILEQCHSFGMPSAHSQFMAFYATFSALTLLDKKFSVFDFLERLFLPWILTVLCCWSRVYLGYHTWLQVFAGFFLGTLLGGIWWLTIKKILILQFPKWRQHWIWKMLLIKDYSQVNDISFFEYQSLLKNKLENGLIDKQK